MRIKDCHPTINTATRLLLRCAHCPGVQASPALAFQPPGFSPRKRTYLYEGVETDVKRGIALLNMINASTWPNHAYTWDTDLSGSLV